MPARHYNLEYNVNSGPWLPGSSDETPGPGKQLTVGGLAVGTYAVKLRMVPLTGDPTPIPSNEVILQVGVPGISEPVQTLASSEATVAELIVRRDTLLAAAGVVVSAADAQVMNEALVSSALAADSATIGFIDTVTAAAEVVATIASAQVMLEQVQAAIAAVAIVADGLVRTEAVTAAAAVVASVVDTYTLGSNNSPIFTQQPSMTSATTTTLTFAYGTSDVEGDHYLREVTTNGGGTWYAGTVADETPGVSKTAVISGLSAGETYSVRFRLTPLAGNLTPVLSAAYVDLQTICAAPAGVSVAPGDAQNVVTVPVVTGASSYSLYWTSDGSTPTTASNKISNAVSPYAHTGRINGTTYKYAAVANNPSGESALSNVVEGVPAAPGAPGTYDLTTGTLDAEIFGYSVAGATAAPTITAGALTLTDGPIGTDAGILFYKPVIARGASGTYRLKLSLSNIPNGDFDVAIGVLESSSFPSVNTGPIFNPLKRITISIQNAVGTYKASSIYVNATSERWVTTGNVWATLGTGSQQTLTILANTAYWFELVSTSTTFKFRILAADGATLLNETPEALWSDVKSTGGNLYLYWGEPYTNGYSSTIFKAYSFQVI